MSATGPVPNQTGVEESMKRSAVVVALAIAACGPSVKSVSIEPARSTLDAKGSTAALRAVPKDEKGQPIEASKVKVAWSAPRPSPPPSTRRAP